MRFPQFTQALNNLGRTDAERAEKLGIPVRTLTRYKSGQLPKSILIWQNYPEILYAFLNDTKECQQETEG